MRWWSLPTLVICCVGSELLAGDVDPRFDGRWVGTETFKFGYFSGQQNSSGSQSGVANTRQDIQTVPAILGIADHGKTVGITKGFATGRYEVVPEKSDGRTLVFQMPGTNGNKLLYVGRKNCTLTLSADGNTIKESGTAILSLSKSGNAVNAQVWATFKREGHY